MNKEICDTDFGTYLLNKNERESCMRELRGRNQALSDFNYEGSEKNSCIDDVSLAFANPESLLMLNLQHSLNLDQLS